MTRAWYQQLVDVLGTSLVFSALEGEERWALARVARKTTLDDGERLWAWGEPGDGVAVILDGALKVQRTFEDATTVVFRRVERGEALGFSALADEPHTADIAAVGRTVVAVLPREDLRRVLAQHPEIALRIIAHLGHLVGLLSDEKTTWRPGTVEERVCAWLEENASTGEVLEITHAFLARQIRASRARVTRALGRLADAGVLHLTRGRVEVLTLLPCRGTRGA